MTPLLALAALMLALASWPSAARADPAEAAAAMLAERWSGVYDTLEQVLYDNYGLAALAADGRVRIRTIVAPVSLPWLGPNVLYLEEFPHDDPGAPRRQVLLRLTSTAPGEAPAVRVRQFTFREPARWRALFESPERSQRLRQRDLEAIPGCDLLLVREGEQFRGGTRGHGCLASPADPGLYVDYRVLVGVDLYWYRKRVLRAGDGELAEETAGYDWFELHQARLFACRVRWSPAGGFGELAPLATFNVHDQGGRAHFVTPDGRAFELQLHSGDWPFDANRDALILIVRELGTSAPLASSWTEIDAEQISIDLDELDVRCGPIAPSSTARAF